MLSVNNVEYHETRQGIAFWGSVFEDGVRIGQFENRGSGGTTQLFNTVGLPMTKGRWANGSVLESLILAYEDEQLEGIE